MHRRDRTPVFTMNIPSALPFDHNESLLKIWSKMLERFLCNSTQSDKNQQILQKMFIANFLHQQYVNQVNHTKMRIYQLCTNLWFTHNQPNNIYVKYWPHLPKKKFSVALSTFKVSTLNKKYNTGIFPSHLKASHNKYSFSLL